MAADRLRSQRGMFHHRRVGAIADCTWCRGNTSFMPVGTQATVKAMSH